jgi:hypothetical protein
MRSPRALPALLGWAALALSCQWTPQITLPCTTDSDCRSPAICFPDGCGDPGKDLKVQVTFNGSQEFEVSEMKATYDQQLRRPPALLGSVTQQTATGPIPYVGKVSFKISGSGLFLPAVRRTVEQQLLPAFGQYVLPVSTGLYTQGVVAGSDPTLPLVPVVDGKLAVAPGDQVSLDVSFPSTASLIRINGTLLKTVTSGPMPVDMEIQAQDTQFHRPITLKQPVDRSTGLFSVLVPPGTPAVELVAWPKEGVSTPDSIVPHLAFPQLANFSLPVVLEMGEFGGTVTVTGTVADADGNPVSNAVVYTERTMPYGHDFTGARVLTTAGTGAFSLRSLPALPNEPVTLWVLPPPGPGQSAGAFQAQVQIPTGGGDLGTLYCPRRVPVTGQVLRPDGQAPAWGVTVLAVPQTGPDGRAPASSPQVVTRPDGSFEFLADPGDYRLDFMPSDQLPKVSRRVHVDSVPSSGSGEPLPVQVPTFTLWNARSLRGTITGFATPTASDPTVLAGATVELFRVAWENGKPVQYSLGQATTESTGGYVMLIPTAPAESNAQADGGAPDGGP